MINRIGFTNSKFITDRWHLYENLKKNFGHLYEQVRLSILIMLHELHSSIYIYNFML